MLSRPVELHWAGWRSDTHTLQQHGWQISADQDFMRNSMTLALRNERAGINGITERVDWRYHHDMMSMSQHHRLNLQVALMAHKIQVMHTSGNYWDNFRPVDAYPQFQPNREIRQMEDLAHFAPAHARTQQLIVPEENVNSLMARILEMQSGARIERIREEIREGQQVSFQQRQKFHAQIVSIAA
jgi:hypothetical protein